MKQLKIYILLLIAAPFIGVAQTKVEYNAELISPDLKAYANAIIRNRETTVEVRSIDDVTYKFKEAITILNRNGEEYSEKVVFYDKSRSVKYVKGALYNKLGVLVYKIPESKFKDYSSIDGISLFTDNRVKHFKPAYSDYPFTIEYEYEIKEKNSIYFPVFFPQTNSDVAVEKSLYTFICSENYPIRTKESNFSGKKSELKDKNKKILTWSIDNLRSYKPEPFSPRAESFLPAVRIAPVNFKYEGIEGSFTNWEEYGKWTYDKILKGRESLPAETIAKIQNLVKDANSPQEKARKVYEYVQGKTRYVSIQKGIGGIQPMKAEEVDRLSYGDCKALTYYTQSLLKVVGIPSLYTELYAGYSIQDVTTDFANMEGNHAILCVPIEKDTVWLECTSQKAPFGFIGSFTDNRKVILCTEKGGVIAKTKSYSPMESSQIRKAFFKIDDEGTLDGKVTTQFKGTQYDNRESIDRLGGKERNDKILTLYSLNNLNIKKYELKQDKLDTPKTIEEFAFISTGFGAKSGTRMFIHVNPLNQNENTLKDLDERKNPIWISRGYYDEDLYEYTLPESYKIEHLPKDIDIQNEFGSFSCKVLLEGNKLTFQRKVLLKDGTFPPSSYETLKTYFQKIYSADRQKVVLVKI